MIPVDLAAVFVLASVALALAPGPDNLFVLTQSALHGAVAGLLVTAGLCTGLVVHTTLVALGVAAVFQTSALAFTVLKVAGAAWLLWLAWGAFRAGATSADGDAATPVGARALYLRGVIMNLTNPKVALFFLAFLPQFAAPGRGALAPQMFVLGGLFMLSAAVVFSAIAGTAGTLGARLQRSPRAQIVLNRLAGTVFAGLALQLAVSSR